MPVFILKLKPMKWVNVFVIYLRYLIGGAFVFSSIPKILGQRFLTSNAETAPIDTFPHLFETLYRSGIYWEFLGWSQLIAALLLMTQVFGTLGAIAFFPILLNVFVITVSYEFAGTPVITGLMLLANCFLLLWDYNRLSVLLTPFNKRDILIPGQQPHFNNDVFWAYLGVLLFITTVIYVYTQGRNPIGWFGICLLEGLSGFIYMSWKYRKTNSVVTNEQLK